MSDSSTSIGQQSRTALSQGSPAISSKKTRIAMTGATSLLGRNLLFEIFKENIHDLDRLELILLGRAKESQALRDRVREMVCEMSEMVSPDELSHILDYCAHRVIYVDSELTEPYTKIDSHSLHQLQRAPIDFFFHLAAISNFRDTPAVRELLHRTNIEGTLNTLELIRELKVGEYCYTGSAYVCGTTTGKIYPDYINLDQPFHNPYELSKLKAEILVREFGTATGVRCRIFRTSTICGRLIEPPLGGVSKYDVFYGWAAFWLRMKASVLGGWSDIYTRPCALDARICYRAAGGFNTVPVDFAAKAMYQVCLQNDPGQSYHLVNDQETPHAMHIPAMLNTVNVEGTSQCETIPVDLNETEAAYYRVLGKTFTPYMTSAPMDFDTDSIRSVLNKSRLRCPPVDAANFQVLMEFAKQHDFGVEHN